MKKLMFLFVVAATIYNLPAMADEQKFEAQYVITAGDEFWTAPVTEISLYATGFLMGNMNNYVSIYGYIGPKVSLSEGLTVYALGGAYNDTGDDEVEGSSALASLWLDYSFGDNDLFCETDYYVPYQLHEHELYFWLSYTRTINEKFDLGLVYEGLQNVKDGKFYESAVGPLLRSGPLRFFLGFDESPAEADNRIFLRTYFDLK